LFSYNYSISEGYDLTEKQHNRLKIEEYGKNYFNRTISIKQMDSLEEIPLGSAVGWGKLRSSKMQKAL